MYFIFVSLYSNWIIFLISGVYFINFNQKNMQAAIFVNVFICFDLVAFIVENTFLQLFVDEINESMN